MATMILMLAAIFAGSTW